MDSDDIYLPHALAVLSKELADNPTAVAAHAIADFIDENGDPMQPGLFAEIGRNRLTCSNGRPARVPLDEPSTFANVVTGSTMFPPGLLLTRRSVVDQVGGYDHTITPADDWDYFIRLCRLGPVAFVNEVLIQYRRHPNNQGAQSKVPEMCRRVYHKAFFSELNTPEQQEVLRQSWHAKQHLILESRLQAAQAHLRKGELLKAIVSLSKVPFIFYRYLRGYPTLGWL
jgi:hypothetical protein